MPLIPKPTDEELKLFFNTNRDKFENNSPMSQISVLSYFSNSSSKIKQAISNPMMMIDGVVRKNQLITAKDVPANIFQIIQKLQREVLLNHNTRVRRGILFLQLLIGLNSQKAELPKT